jgi:CheY-like chemotaxis protein
MNNGHEPRFLYVEDDKRSRVVMKILLRDVMGYSELFLFEDSTDFLERVKALPYVPDVIFLDVQMGPHDGHEMLHMLRNEPAYQDVAIIAMTANVMSHDIEQLREAGFSGLIGKPILKEIFPELVEKLLAGESVWYVP